MGRLSVMSQNSLTSILSQRARRKTFGPLYSLSRRERAGVRAA